MDVITMILITILLYVFDKDQQKNPITEKRKRIYISMHRPGKHRYLYRMIRFYLFLIQAHFLRARRFCTQMSFSLKKKLLKTM